MQFRIAKHSFDSIAGTIDKLVLWIILIRNPALQFFWLVPGFVSQQSSDYLGRDNRPNRRA